MNPSMDQEELAILKTLDTILRQKSVRTAIRPILIAAEAKLVEDSEALLAWEPIPRATYGHTLLYMIRSSWVFVIRARANSGMESHPNSHQRTMSYRGSGDLQIWTGVGWRSHPLISDPEAPIEQRWISIPPRVPHQAVAPQENWVVLSFHTASPRELLEERPDSSNAKGTHQRKYLFWANGASAGW